MPLPSPDITPPPHRASLPPPPVVRAGPAMPLPSPVINKPLPPSPDMNLGRTSGQVNVVQAVNPNVTNNMEDEPIFGEIGGLYSPRESVQPNRESVQSTRDSGQPNRDSAQSNRDSVQSNRESVQSNRDSVHSNRDPLNATYNNRESVVATYRETSHLPANESHRSRNDSQRDSQQQRNNRSSLIEPQAKSPTDLQNLEPYDVLFLSNEQTPSNHGRLPPGVISSTPDVALSTPSLHDISPRQVPPPSRPLQHRHSTYIGSVRLTGKQQIPQVKDDSSLSVSETGTTSRWKVSAKIQQLLNTLKKPKRRPLQGFFEDDDVELAIAASTKQDPNAPTPEGNTMTPAMGPQLVIPAGLPRNLEAAIQRYGSATYKAPVATVLDPNGKLTITRRHGP